MQFRLWHILALMGLILLAGVLSIQQLEAHVGRTTVPGIVLIDVPGLSPEAAEAAIRRWPGALLQWVAADDAPLAPFDHAVVRTLRARGSASALLRPGPGEQGGSGSEASGSGPGSPAAAPAAPDPDEALHQAWGVLITGLDTEAAVTKLAAFLRGCDGVRPFLVGLQLHEPTAAELLAAVSRQVDAAASLPSFRRTTVLVLGAREAQTRRRLVVRIDRGEMDLFPPPGLSDLLGRAR